MFEYIWSDTATEYGQHLLTLKQEQGQRQQIEINLKHEAQEDYELNELLYRALLLFTTWRLEKTNIEQKLRRHNICY